MPAPLAIPPMRTVLPAMRPSTATDFSRVSVVIIACAAALPPFEFRAETAEEIPFSILGTGRKLPITPVLATRTWQASTLRLDARHCALISESCIPLSPVQAFAHPELIRTARARPRDCFRFSLLRITGAACTRLRVKTPAADAGCDVNTTARSSPFFLIPADTPAARYP